MSKKYLRFSNHVEKMPYTIMHKENGIETFIATTDTAEKADFIEKACNEFSNESKDDFAVQFADWLDALSPSQRVSVWSKNGEYSGLFTMDNEQLLDKFKRELAKKEKEVAENADSGSSAGIS